MRFVLFTVIVFAGLISFADVKKKRPATVVIKDTRAIEKRYKLIPLGVMNYESAERICRPWLTKGGLFVNEKHKNSVLVYDTPKVIYRISSFLRDMDRNAPNIRITFDLDESGIDNVTYIKGPPVRIEGKGKRGRKRRKSALEARYEKAKERKFTSQFIVTRSGLSASIWVGETRIDPSWLRFIRYNRGKTIVLQDGNVIVETSTVGEPEWTKVGASLQVRPFWYDDGTIDVEIFPEIRYLTKSGRHKNVKVKALSTRVRVKEGQRINIGGLISGRKKSYVNVFGPDFFKRKDISKISNMYLKAERVSSHARSFRQPSGLRRPNSNIPRGSTNYKYKKFKFSDSEK